MDYRDAVQIQGQTPSTAAAVTQKLPVAGLGRYLRAMETLRLGATRASRELLRAMLEVVEQDLEDAESHAQSAVPVDKHGVPHPSGKPVPASPSKRFRGVPPLREGSVTPESPLPGVTK